MEYSIKMYADGGWWFGTLTYTILSTYDKVILKYI